MKIQAHRFALRAASLIATCLFVWVPGNAASAPTESYWIAAQMVQWQVPGAVVAIVRPDAPVRFYALGFCNLATRKRCSLDSTFLMGSTTKMVTGLVAATLASEGVVSLDEPLIRRWPEFRLSDTRDQRVTLTDLLTQRSGLTSVDWPYFWDPTLSTPDYLARVHQLPMAGEFRQSWHYANANFVLAGAYLQRVTGTPWETLVQERIFDPLGMHHSGFGNTRGSSVGYAVMGGARAIPVESINPVAIAPAGGMVSSARDFSNLLTMLLQQGRYQGHLVIQESAIESVTAPTMPLETDSSSYGFGVFRSIRHGDVVFHHPGSMIGFSTAFVFAPERHIAVVVLTNSGASYFPEALAYALLDQSVGRDAQRTMRGWYRGSHPLMPQAAVESRDTAMSLRSDELTGTYDNTAWPDITIESERDDTLMFKVGSFRSPLTRLHGTTFTVVPAPGATALSVDFQSGDNSPAPALTLKDPDDQIPFQFKRADGVVESPVR